MERRTNSAAGGLHAAFTVFTSAASLWEGGGPKQLNPNLNFCQLENYAFVKKSSSKNTKFGPGCKSAILAHIVENLRTKLIFSTRNLENLCLIWKILFQKNINSELEIPHFGIFSRNSEPNLKFFEQKLSSPLLRICYHLFDKIVTSNFLNQ